MSTKHLITVLCMLCSVTAGHAMARSAEDYLAEGRAALFNGRISGLYAAYEIFDEGLNDTACVDCQNSRDLIFLHAVTRIAMWAFRDDGPPINSAREFGQEYDVVLSGDLYDGLVITGLGELFPLNNRDSYDIPEDWETLLADLATFMDGAAVDEVSAVIEELDRITETPDDHFRMFFTPRETAMFLDSPEPVLTNDIEVDYGEVLLLKGALSALRAVLRSRAAYDFHVEPEDMLIEKMYGECFSINNDLLLPHPDFLKLLPTANDPNDGTAILAQAKQDWITALNDYLTAIEYILAENDPPGSDPQEDELLFLAANDLRAIRAIDAKVRTLLNSLENDETGTFTYETTDSYNLEKDGAAIGNMELISDAWAEGEDGLMALQYCGRTPSQWEISEWDIEDGMIYADVESRTSDLGYEFLRNLDSAHSVLFTPVECPGMIPYEYEMLDSSLFEATGSPKGWKADDYQWSFVLPFEFPYFGAVYTAVNVSSNGYLDFGDGSHIQPLYSDLRTDRQPDQDIYIDAAENEVKIRWQGEYYGQAVACNFSVTLFRDGRIRFDYGPGNSGYVYSVGISNDDGSWAIQLGRDSYFYGFLSGAVDEASGSITNATLEFWGSRSGLIENISAEVTGTTMLQELVDPNPVFGSSARYPNPVSPRDLLPQFDAWNAALPDTLGSGLGGDATLGGILPEMTHDQWRDRFELQPAANLEWEPVEAWQLTDGWVSSWKPEQLVLDDATGDIPERYAAIGGLDVTTLHLGHDTQYLYGSLALHNAMLPDGNYDFGVALSRDPDDLDAMNTVEAHMRINAGVIDAAVVHHTFSAYGYDTWEEISGVEVVSVGNRLDFRIPLDAMSDYLHGRFVSVTSEWQWSGVDENYTHIRMGHVGTVSGTVTYDAYNGAPIFVQAYLDPTDPEGSVIAAAMITEPGPYVLEGIGVGWTGYVRAFTPLFGFNVLDMGALEIEKSAFAVMDGDSAEGVDIVLENPPVLERNVAAAGEIDTDVNRRDIYAFDCVKGGRYTLELTRQTAENTFMILLARDGDDELAETSYYNPQPLTWQCERAGTYYVEIEDYPWQTTGGTYQILLTSEPVIFADANLKAAVEAALGITNPTPEDMLNLTTLDASGQGIADLTGLEFAVGIEHLDLNGNQISDISPLADLTHLVYLDLSGNSLDDLAYSQYLPQILANNPGIDLLYDEAGPYSGGAGTAADPHRISTVADWQELMATVGDWDKHFILTADLDLAGISLVPVGTGYSQPFTGVFDGNGHVIRDAVIDQPSSDYVGLFGYLGSDSQIRNLGVENVNITGRNFVGGLVGWNDSGTLTSCYATGSVSGSDSVGGLVGVNISGTLTSCYAAGSVSDGDYVGGLVGWNYYGTLTSCYATGSVSGTDYVGGLVGYNWGGTLTSCHATGSVSGGDYVGGLVGWNDSGTLTSCYATGSVSGTGYYVGGLVGGTSEGTLTACYATGSVSGTGGWVGGLVGGNDFGTLTSCYATGSVSGTGDWVGGLVGENYYGTLTSCYATGSVGGIDSVGGLVGLNYGTLSSCVWDVETSGRSVGVGYGTSTGVTGKTTAQMKTLSTFTDAGWDFVGEIANGLNDYWQMESNEYPRLALHAWTLSGDGAPANPYVVASAADSGKVWLRPSACYRLGGNLDLTGISWSSAVVPAFAGVFDGQGFVISNLTINQPGSDDIGLFGRVYAGGQVRNLGVENVNITGQNYVGGLVGYNDSGTLTSCYATGSVSGIYDVGGLVGYNCLGTISGCYTTGPVAGTGSVGGLVGENYSGTLTSCYATGSVSGTGDKVGGLVGWNEPGTLTSCYATGSVSGYRGVGGLVGWNYGGTLTSCYATGSVGGTDSVGGLVGYNAGTLTSCFWDVETSGLSVGVGYGISTGVTGKTTAEMQDIQTFLNAGWDFVDTWWMPPSKYPRLQWELGQPVVFADANLKAAIEAELGVTDPTPTDMLGLTSLNAGGQGITDLAGLEFAVNLAQLDLSGNQISDISVLAGLTGLQQLDLKGNLLNDAAYFSHLAQIQANNPGVVLTYDDRQDMPGDVEGRIYVDCRAPAGGDGSTWLKALRYLQDAMAAAQAGDSIWVAEGTYRPDQGAGVTPGDRTAKFQLKYGVALHGGFKSGGLWEDRDAEQYETILSGDLNGDDGQGNFSDNCYHVVTANGASLAAVLDGFTIRAGNADLAGMKGGGLLCVFGGATLRNCILENNRATCAAAMDCRDSSLSLEDVILQSNAAPTDCHAAFSRSHVNIQGLVSISDGQVNTYASDFYGAGAVEFAATGEWIVNNAETCGAKIITNIYGGLMEPATIYLSPFGGWKGQWWIPGAALWNTVVAGEDTAWCIAPDFAGYPATLLWYGNELADDLSVAGQAEAQFRSGGELLIYGELYDGIDAGANLLFDGLLLWAEVGPMHVRESGNQLGLTTPAEVTPLGGFLAANDSGLKMSGVQLMNLVLGYCVQRNGPVNNFGSDIETASESTLSMVASGLPQAVTTVACDVVGAGGVDIQAGAELRLDGGLIRLRDEADNPGSVSVDGKLVALNEATVRDSEIAVHSASYVAGSQVHRKGVGGEFFVQGAVTITGNTILAEGDRYLDFDLPYPRTPAVSGNHFIVTIPAEVRGEQGTLLELRGRDADCNEAANPDCASGAHHATLGERFAGEPADNWILDRLELLGAARLNLTDRRGFAYNGGGQREAVYVRQLALGPDSVLNTALQTLYYEDLILVDSQGHEIGRNPADLSVPFINGSRIIDIPLLGFSLKIIDMNDPTPSPSNEFDIRVDVRLTDEADQAVVGDGLPLPQGEVIRMPDARGAGDGAMEMATYGPDIFSASSVAAKGAFARAADEVITVEFEYQFVKIGQEGAEIIVYLSDDPDVSENLVEIARIRPPAEDRPGALYSGGYGLFSGAFARGTLNFTRGTYVELELRGRDSRCRIDNWDPAVECDRTVCGDYTDPRHVATIEDYLLMLSHFGATLAGTSDRGCLDLNKDGYVGFEDLAAWNIVDGPKLNLCPDASMDSTPPSMPGPMAAPSVGKYEPLVIAAQPGGNGGIVPDNYLYSVRSNGLVMQSNMMLEPGRLATDAGGHMFFNQGHAGPVDAQTGRPKLGSVRGLRCRNGAMVSVGVDVGAKGLPITDIAVSPGDPNTLYVVPVLVTPAGGAHPYRGAAKLVFSDDPNQPACRVDQLYALDPEDYSSHVFTASDGRGLHNPDFEHVSEIELDAQGHVLLLSAHGYSDNKWILIFKEDDANALCGRVDLGALGIEAPTAMLASASASCAYLTARAGGTQTPASVVYRLAMVDDGEGRVDLQLADEIQIVAPVPALCSDVPSACQGGYITAITSLAENPGDGTVYAVGFTIPKLIEAEPQWPAIIRRGIFATPFLAEIPPDGSEAITRLFTDSGPTAPVLPMSIIWTGGRPPCDGADITGDGAVRLEDFAGLASQWLAESPDLSADIAAERRYDGMVEIRDLAAFIDHWLRTDCR